MQTGARDPLRTWPDFERPMLCRRCSRAPLVLIGDCDTAVLTDAIRSLFSFRLFSPQECRERPPGRRIFSWRTTRSPSSGECPWTRTESRTSGRSSPRWRSRARARRRRRADCCWLLVGLVHSRPLPVLCCRTYQIPTNFRLEGRGGGGGRGGVRGGVGCLISLLFRRRALILPR